MKPLFWILAGASLVLSAGAVVIVVVLGRYQTTILTAMDARLRDLHPDIDFRPLPDPNLIHLDFTAPNGYQRYTNTFGVFLIRTKSCEPYLDGHRAVISIGNLTSGNFLGTQITASWRATENSSNTWPVREFTTTTEIPSGFWSDIILTLSPSSPASMKDVVFMCDLNQLHLKNRD